MLPRIDLPDALLEIHIRNGSADEFTRISDNTARVADLPISLCAVLLAEACNIGLEPLVRRDVPALTYGRLRWVQQNYFRAETISRANARLVDAQCQIALALAWGGGEVATADGLRFVVPVRTLKLLCQAFPRMRATCLPACSSSGPAQPRSRSSPKAGPSLLHGHLSPGSMRRAGTGAAT